MKSIKPGRGPSMMGGVGSVIAAIFGVFWTIGAVQMGARFSSRCLACCSLSWRRCRRGTISTMPRPVTDSLPLTSWTAVKNPIRWIPDGPAAMKHPGTVHDTAHTAAPRLPQIINSVRNAGKNCIEGGVEILMSMNASKSFSRMLRQYRLTHHLTQEEMAERCCISTRHYCDLENGYVDPG